MKSLIIIPFLFIACNFAIAGTVDSTLISTLRKHITNIDSVSKYVLSTDEIFVLDTQIAVGIKARFKLLKLIVSNTNFTITVIYDKIENQYIVLNAGYRGHTKVNPNVDSILVKTFPFFTNVTDYLNFCTDFIVPGIFGTWYPNKNIVLGYYKKDKVTLHSAKKAVTQYSKKCKKNLSELSKYSFYATSHYKDWIVPCRGKNRMLWNSIWIVDLGSSKSKFTQLTGEATGGITTFQDFIPNAHNIFGHDVIWQW